MYRDDYRDEFDRDLDQPRSSLYPRDLRDPYFDERPSRERSYDFESRDRGLRSSYAPPPPPPLMDDPYYRRLDDLEARLLSRSREPPPPSTLDPVEQGALVHGTVIIIPPSPFEPKPKRREKPANCDTVFVGSLPDNTTEKHLYDLFSKCGKINDVRISRGRNFGHVQFSNEESVVLAVELSNCRIRVGPSNLPADTGKIHVDYAQPKGDPELQRRIQENEMMVFNVHNASTVSSDLHRDEAFAYAAKNVVHWIDRGHCNQSTANTFFGLISSINTHSRKVAKSIKTKEEEAMEFMQKRREFFESLEKDCGVLENVFEVTCQQKCWSHFTKPQRKSILQWKEFVANLLFQIRKAMSDEMIVTDGAEPAAKKARVEPDTQLEADLDRAHKEIEQLKTDHEIALERKDKQILQLKTLMAKFKQSCPDEWEKAIGGPAKAAGEAKEKKSKKSQPLPPGVEEPKEEIEGVSLDDLNNAMELDEDNPLAAVAAAYAQMRSSLGSTETAVGFGLSEVEVAIVSVLASFLTVHPLGASVDEITGYFQVFNPAYTSYYLESLLNRLPQVFQLSRPADGGSAKWWFLGFQTCCSQTQVQYTNPPGDKAPDTTVPSTSS